MCLKKSGSDSKRGQYEGSSKSYGNGNVAQGIQLTDDKGRTPTSYDELSDYLDYVKESRVLEDDTKIMHVAVEYTGDY